MKNMIKKVMNDKILWIVTIVPLLVTLIVIQFMGEKVPMHYNAAGEIDRWGSPYENLIFPVIIILCTIFWQCFLGHYRKKQKTAKTDKERQEAASNEKVIYYTAVGMAIMFGIMNYLYLYNAIVESKENLTKMALDVNSITCIAMGVFLIFIGNILPKTRNNSSVGLRTVWSMENDRTWAVSNRFAGKAIMIAGVLIIIEGLLVKGIMSVFILLGIIIGTGVIAVIYSYKTYKKYK